MTDILNFSTKQDGFEAACTSGVCEIKYSDSWNPSAFRKNNANQPGTIEQCDTSVVDTLVHA
ncbi:MAG TPA: hypothetical protein V6C76_01910 [Drouetiella sp.]